MSDRVSRFIQSEIDQINTHLPQKVLSLLLVSKMKEPGMRTRDGEFSAFDIEELKQLQELIPPSNWKDVLLPIIITRRRDLGEGAFKVSGGDANQYIIESIFDKLPSYPLWKLTKNKDKLFYRPHIKQIRKQYKTTTVIAFT